MTKNKIQYTTSVKPDFINELREKVKNYFEMNHISKFGNTNIWFQSLLMTILYLGPLLLMLSGVVVSLPWILLCWIIMGAGMAGVGMTIMHDANHGSYSKNIKINKLLSKSLYFLGGFPPTWQYQHNTLHHGFTNIEGQDEDIDPIGILRFSPHKPLYKIHRYQNWYAWFFYGLMTISWATFKDFKQLSCYKQAGAVLTGRKSYRQMLFHLVLWKMFYYTLFLLIPLSLLPIPWYWVVLSFLFMHFTSGLILGVIFQTAHVVTSSTYPLPDENGNLANSWAVHQLATTSDYAPKSRIFSWLIGGLNYQVEHHLFPNISHVHYGKLSLLVRDTALKYGLPYYVQPTFLSALKNHAKMLKLLGR